MIGFLIIVVLAAMMGETTGNYDAFYNFINQRTPTHMSLERSLTFYAQIITGKNPNATWVDEYKTAAKIQGVTSKIFTSPLLHRFN